MAKTTGDVIVEKLIDWGVDTAFGLPGDGINGIFEALRKNKDKIRFIQCRHEEAAAFAACGYAKFTGRLGVCFATSGPGAVHLLNGLYYYSVKSYERSRGIVRMNSMNKTHTPELTPEVLGRLRSYAELFRDDFRHEAQRSWSGVYLRGLLQDGERKSIEPMVGRVPLPAELLATRDPEQALQQFVNQSPWDEQRVLHRYRTADGPDLRQPRGDLRHRRYRLPQAGQALRRRPASILRPTGQAGQLPGRRHAPLCQPRGAFPGGAAALPARSPGPVPRDGSRRPASPSDTAGERTKGEIALELLDQVRGEGLLPGRLVVTDCGLRGLPGRSARGWSGGGCPTSRGVAGDGRLHRGARVGAARDRRRGRQGRADGRGGGPGWRRASRDR